MDTVVGGVNCGAQHAAPEPAAARATVAAMPGLLLRRSRPIITERRPPSDETDRKNALAYA